LGGEGGEDSRDWIVASMEEGEEGDLLTAQLWRGYERSEFGKVIVSYSYRRCVRFRPSKHHLLLQEYRVRIRLKSSTNKVCRIGIRCSVRHDSNKRRQYTTFLNVTLAGC